MATVTVNQTTTYDLSASAPDLFFSKQTYIDVTTANAGVYGAAGTSWQIGNAGKIVGDDAFDFAGAAELTNLATGSIMAVGASDGVLIGGSGSVGNSGTITASALAIDIKGKGIVTNTSTGLIYGTVLLEAGGMVTNSGSITTATDSSDAVDLAAGGKVVNSGKIGVTGNGDIGIELANGGAVDNSGTLTATGNSMTGINLVSASPSKNTGRIVLSGSGDVGVNMNGAEAALFTNSGYIGGNSVSFSDGIFSGTTGSKVVNSGNIDFSGSVALSGVDLASSATLDNLGDITIVTTGNAAYGVIMGAAGKTTNSGSISVSGASDVDGVQMRGGSFVNTATGSVASSGVAVLAVGSGGNVTVVDAGLLSGAESVWFDNTGPAIDTLMLMTGADLVGAAIGSTDSLVDNVVELAGHGALANAFEGFQKLRVEASADWTLTGSVEAAETTVGKGAKLTIGVSGDLQGALTLYGGTAIFDSAYDDNVAFDGVSHLDLSTATYTGKVSGLATGDKIDFLAFKYANGDHAVVSGNELTIEKFSGAAIVSIKLGGGTYESADFGVFNGVDDSLLLQHK